MNPVRAPVDRRRHRYCARAFLASPRPIELYRGNPIPYGCGDVIDDYEGIGGHESYRPDLRLLYLISINPGRGELAAIRMLPLRVRRMRLERVSETDVQWLRATMEHISRRFGIDVATVSDELLTVHPRRESRGPIRIG